ncbi:MAG: leucine-rich repeat protein [Treponema sp.]|nr:leucine-rich repeat protein [Treponema sp.]
MKKSKYNLLFKVVSLIFFTAFVFYACGGVDPDYIYYTVTFDSMGANEKPESQTVYPGYKIIQPKGLKNSVLELDGWYREKTFVTKWNFASDNPSKDMTLYARWVLKDLTGLQDYFDDKEEEGDDKEKPLRLPIAVNLGMMETDNSVLDNIIEVIAEKDKFVILDLSLSAVVSGIFNLGYEHEGKAKIVELVLPEEAEELYGKMGYINLEADKDEDKFISVLESIRGTGIVNIATQLFVLDGINSQLVEDIVEASLKTVDFPNVKNIFGYTFYGCTALEDVNIPELVYIGERTFVDCISLETVDFPKAEYIGKNAFAGCEKLKEANFPLAAHIDNKAFEGCIALESLDLPIVVIIGNYAFADCEILEEASFPLVTAIGDSAFAGCEALEKICFPKAVTIGSEAFASCEKLKTVSFPLVTDIGDSAFEGCAALETAAFPIVETIGSKAFFDCDEFKEITFGTEPPEFPVSGEVFLGGTPDDFTINRPAASGDAYDEWFNEKSENFNNDGNSIKFKDF